MHSLMRPREVLHLSARLSLSRPSCPLVHLYRARIRREWVSRGSRRSSEPMVVPPAVGRFENLANERRGSARQARVGVKPAPIPLSGHLKAGGPRDLTSHGAPFQILSAFPYPADYPSLRFSRVTIDSLIVNRRSVPFASRSTHFVRPSTEQLAFKNDFTRRPPVLTFPSFFLSV